MLHISYVNVAKSKHRFSVVPHNTTYTVVMVHNGNIVLLCVILSSSTGKEFSPQGFYALMFVIAIPLFYFGSAGSTVFWIIGECVCV